MLYKKFPFLPNLWIDLAFISWNLEFYLIQVSPGSLRERETNLTKKVLKQHCWDFPGGPMAKTPGFQCMGPWFDPWSGN